MEIVCVKRLTLSAEGLFETNRKLGTALAKVRLCHDFLFFLFFNEVMVLNFVTLFAS